MRSLAIFVGPLMLLGGLTLQCAEPTTSAESCAEPAQGYASPQAAFRAARTAVCERDWRTFFLSLTPAAQDAEVFTTFDGSTFNEETPKIRDAMTRYGLELKSVLADYSKKYREKHGVDLDKIGKDYEKQLQAWRTSNAAMIKEYSKKMAETYGAGACAPAPPGEPSPPQYPSVDESLLEEVVLRRVKDKLGFYVETNDLIKGTGKRDAMDLDPDLGDLLELTASGDTARGCFVVTMYCLHGEPGRPDAKEKPLSQRRPWSFRKVSGRWYNEK